jgi:tetratricopeptide (TPR) repeat protein
LEELSRVAAICRSLDGLPLCIEMAAAATSRLGLADLERELSLHLGALVSTERRTPERHRNFRSLLQWNCRRLSEEERRLFARLSIFSGGWTLEAMVAVCDLEGVGPAEVKRLHGRLVEQSFIEIDPRRDRRFRMLEPARRFAAELLASASEEGTLSERHFDHYLEAARRAVASEEERREPPAFVDLEEDHENLDAALEQAWERGDGDAAGRVAMLLAPFWLARGHWRQGHEWLERLLAATADPPIAMIRMLGDFALAHGELSEADGHFQRSLAAAAGDRAEVGHAESGLGIIAFRRGRLDEARGHWEESLAIWRETGHMRSVVLTVNNLAALAATLHEFDEASERFHEVLTLAGEIGEERCVASSLVNLGLIAWNRRGFEQAEDFFRRSLEVWRSVGDPWGDANALSNLGVLEWTRERVEAAAACHAQSLALRRSIGDLPGVAASLEGLVSVAVSRRQSERAARLLAGAGEIRRRIGAPLSADNQAVLDRNVARVKDELGAAGWERESAVAALLDWREIVDTALEEEAEPPRTTRGSGSASRSRSIASPRPESCR